MDMKNLGMEGARQIYKSVKPRRVSDQVFQQIRDLIFRGQLKPGQRMPSERELSTIMGVSRPTVREAIQSLVNRGLVEQRQGQGTFVSQPEAGQAGNPLMKVLAGQPADLTELLEVRLGLECNAAVLAARRATGQDISMMEQSCRQMRAQADAGELISDEDVHFHMCLAYATKNAVHVQIMRNFYDMLHFGIRENLLALYEDRINIMAVLGHHEKVMMAVRAHDTQAAHEAMQQHILYVIDFFVGGQPLMVGVEQD